MRKPEQRLWDAMRTACPPDILLDRIENVAGVGTADLFVKAKTAARSCWIELKAANLPKRAVTRVLGERGLSTEQINWHSRRQTFAVPTYVLLRDDSMQLYLISGIKALSINAMTQPELAAASLASSWGAVWEVLRSL